jgi:hypothetical protein
MKQSCADILALLHLNPDGITAIEALNEAGCFRLGARIFDLKALGYPIEADWVTTMTGKRVARYRLVTDDTRFRASSCSHRWRREGSLCWCDRCGVEAEQQRMAI